MCNSKQPLISIIVCVYNTEKYIAKCLKSICAQTYANIEIIVVNDGSTDKTAMIINEWQEKDERIVLVQQENKGLAVARNVGLDISRGEYIGFVDADDYIEKDMFQILYDAILQSDCMLSMCAYRIMDANGKLFPKNIENPKSQIYDVEKFFFTAIADRMYYGMCVCAWNKLYKKSLFDGLRYPIEKLYEDNWMIHKLIYKAKSVVFIDKELYYYRRTDNSIMHCAFSLKRFDNYFAQVDRIAFFEKNHASRNLIDAWKVDCVKFGISYWFRMKDSKCATKEEEKEYYTAVKNSIQDFVKLCPIPLRMKEIIFLKMPHLFFLLHCAKQN